MKKKTPETLEELCNELFHKDTITGFQFTVSYRHNYNNNLGFSSDINKSESNVVIDCLESDVSRKITEELFPELPDHPQISDWKLLQPQQVDPIIKIFTDLGYQVEEADFAGKWIWLRVNCKYSEIPTHVQNLKNKLNENPIRS
jgi:hypothetical protein